MPFQLEGISNTNTILTNRIFNRRVLSYKKLFLIHKWKFLRVLLFVMDVLLTLYRLSRMYKTSDPPYKTYIKMKFSKNRFLVGSPRQTMLPNLDLKSDSFAKHYFQIKMSDSMQNIRVVSCNTAVDRYLRNNPHHSCYQSFSFSLPFLYFSFQAVSLFFSFTLIFNLLQTNLSTKTIHTNQKTLNNFLSNKPHFLQDFRAIHESNNNILPLFSHLHNDLRDQNQLGTARLCFHNTPLFTANTTIKDNTKNSKIFSSKKFFERIYKNEALDELTAWVSLDRALTQGRICF